MGAETEAWRRRASTVCLSGRVGESEAATRSVARRTALVLGLAAAGWPLRVRAEVLSLQDAPRSSLPKGACFH